MKTIIVATDYSATASNAVRFAAGLARVFQANLVLFNVYQLSIHAQNGLVNPSSIDHLVRDNEDRLKELAKEISVQFEIDAKGVCKKDDPIGALVEYMASHAGDLVVMGMDSNRFEYKLLGNATTGAIHRLAFPVLVVPNDVVFKGKVARIIYACEYKYLSEDNHLDLLKEFTRKFGAELRLVHVEAGVHEVAVNTGLRNPGIDKIMENVDYTYKVVEHERVGDGLLEEAEAWGADLLVMVPHKPGFWESLFNGSATREMTLRTRVPLLVLPN